MASAVHNPNDSDIPEAHAVRFEHGQAIWEMQPGYAEGCFDLRNRGYGMGYNSITAWPTHRYRLTTGRALELTYLNIHGLYQQEIYVYLLEMGYAVKAILDSLSDPDPVERVCRMCPNLCAIRSDTGTARMYCSRSCQNKFIAWSQLAKQLTQEFQEKQ